MKSSKVLSVFLAATTVLAACSSSSDPSAPQALLASPTPYSTLYPNQPLYSGNPYLMNQNGNFGQLNAQAQFQLQFQAQAMYSYQHRTDGFFYLPSYTMNNCQVRSQPTYTPTSCACFSAPCNCAEIIDTLRSTCSYDTTIHVSATETVKDTTNGYNPNSPLLFLTISGDDAKAIYETLQIKVEQNDKANVRTGVNMKCSESEDKSGAKEYACDFDMEKATGIVYQQSPAGEAVESDPSLPTATHNGPNVTLTADGIASVKVQGKAAIDLYNKVNSSVSDSVLPTDASVSAKEKAGKQVTCFQSVARHPITECFLELNAKTGEFQAVKP